MAGGYGTVTAGTVIAAATHNEYVRDQVVSQFTTTGNRNAAITSPVVGMVTAISSNDSAEGLEFRNSASQWRKIWNMPWGVIGYAAITANQTGITTVADITSLTLTHTAVNNRRYRITGRINIQSNTVSDYGQIQLTDSTPTQLENSLFNTHTSANNDTTQSIVFVEAGISGSVTRKLRAGRAGGSAGTFQVSASATAPAFILIEDIGPSGAPA